MHHHTYYNRFLPEKRAQVRSSWVKCIKKERLKISVSLTIIIPSPNFSRKLFLKERNLCGQALCQLTTWKSCKLLATQLTGTSILFSPLISSSCLYSLLLFLSHSHSKSTSFSVHCSNQPPPHFHSATLFPHSFAPTALSLSPLTILQYKTFSICSFFRSLTSCSLQHLPFNPVPLFLCRCFVSSLTSWSVTRSIVSRDVVSSSSLLFYFFILSLQRERREIQKYLRRMPFWQLVIHDLSGKSSNYSSIPCHLDTWLIITVNMCQADARCLFKFKRGSFFWVEHKFATEEREGI